jgi:hypothetical protein
VLVYRLQFTVYRTAELYKNKNKNKKRTAELYKDKYKDKKGTARLYENKNKDKDKKRTAERGQRGCRKTKTKTNTNTKTKTNN